MKYYEISLKNIEKLNEAPEVAEPPEEPRKKTTTKTKTKPDVNYDPFQQQPDQPLTNRPEKPQGQQRPQGPTIRRASQADTQRAAAGVRLPPEAMRHLQNLGNIEIDPNLADYPARPDEPEFLPSTRVNTENLPTVAGQALAAEGIASPAFHQVASLPGNMSRMIRQLGKLLFGSMTTTATEDIYMIGNLGGQGPNTRMDVNSVANFVREHGEDLGPGDIDFDRVMPGYTAQTHQYVAAGIRWLLVRDFAGEYIYCWPEADSTTPDNQAQLGNAPRRLGENDDDLFAPSTRIELLGKAKKDPYSAYEYARDVIRGRWPEAEPLIMQHPQSAYEYARSVIEGRWPEAEPRIMRDPKCAYWYVRDIIGGRWPEAEPAIMQDPQWACQYARWVIRGRWPEAEPVIMRDPSSAYYYAKNVIGGRWPEAELYIMQDPNFAGLYKKYFKIRGKFGDLFDLQDPDDPWADEDDWEEEEYDEEDLDENDDDLFAPSDRLHRFYVYHKIKGDRAGGASYDFLKKFSTKDSAVAFASSYNNNISADKKIFHSAVVRTKPVKQEIDEGDVKGASSENDDDMFAPIGSFDYELAKDLAAEVIRMLPDDDVGIDVEFEDTNDLYSWFIESMSDEEANYWADIMDDMNDAEMEQALRLVNRHISKRGGTITENDDDLFEPSDRVQKDIEDYNHPLKDVGNCDKTDYDMLINEIDYTINVLGDSPGFNEELSLVIDQLEYSLDPALVKFLDSVLAGAIAVGSNRFNLSLVQALRDGEHRHGTEPRPAVHAAVDALARGWKNVRRVQDRRDN